MSEPLSLTSIALIVLTIILFALLAKTTYEYRRQVRLATQEIEQRIDELETQAKQLDKEVNRLLKEAGKKVDKKYLEKRIAGLAELINK